MGQRGIAARAAREPSRERRESIHGGFGRAIHGADDPGRALSLHAPLCCGFTALGVVRRECARQRSDRAVACARLTGSRAPSPVAISRTQRYATFHGAGYPADNGAGPADDRLPSPHDAAIRCERDQPHAHQRSEAPGFSMWGLPGSSAPLMARPKPPWTDSRRSREPPHREARSLAALVRTPGDQAQTVRSRRMTSASSRPPSAW